MDLNALLTRSHIAPEKVLVLRHRPHERALNRVFPWLAAERPELFNAFQQTHGPALEGALSTLQNSGYVASFFGRQPGQALFVGLYKVGNAHRMTYDQYWSLPAHKELKALGMEGFQKDKHRPSLLRFDLSPVDFYTSWKGKLIVSWPPPERSWWRRAHRNEMKVLAILEESVLDSLVPDWTEIALSWEELLILPRRWRDVLSQWRGVYHILDASDGMRYIGSASGAENILGRWKDYAKSGHGGNRLLRKRDPTNFTFTILQRVSPDLTSAEVSGIEATWKRRLHTRHPQGLNDN